MADVREAKERFTMHGAREAAELGAFSISNHIKALEDAVQDSPGYAFDLAKTLVETICKTVLKEGGRSIDESWELPKLARETFQAMSLFPGSANSDARVVESVKKTVGSLASLIHGICELRNRLGTVSHGRDPSFREPDSTQALLVARSADAIVNFVFRVHRGYPPIESSARIEYSDNPTFNHHVDELNEAVHVFSLTYSPSEVLFQVDRQAYLNALNDYQEESEAAESPTEGQPRVDE